MLFGLMMMGSADPTGVKRIGLNIMDTTNKCKIPGCIFFLIIIPIRCTNFSNLFWIETLHVSDSSSVHHQEFFTIHTAMVYVIQVC